MQGNLHQNFWRGGGGSKELSIYKFILDLNVFKKKKKWLHFSRSFKWGSISEILKK